ncbi:MAG: segregation and condensation protein A [Phycisphaerae bacterium]
MSAEYRVQLDIFAGPLDLLLYLIRRDELDIQDVALAKVTEQYVAYARLMEALDPNSAGEFLVLASTLVEMKSRAILPTPPLEVVDDDSPDSPGALIRQLLEYKRFKDAARTLGSAADERARRFVRRPGSLPPELLGVELEEVEVWDLVSAFGRVMSSIGQGPSTHNVTYDDMPIETRVTRLEKMLIDRGATRFDELFNESSSKSEVVGTFLALLELIRRRRVKAEQEGVFGKIYLVLQEEVDEEPQSEEEAAALAAPAMAVAEIAAAHADHESTEVRDEQG